MEEKIKIRKGKLEDIPKIHKLGKTTKELEFSQKMNFHDKNELKEFITKTKDNILLIATANNRLIGFIYAKIVSKTWCLLDNLVVNKDYREHGVGSLLLEELYNQLKIKKVNYIQILEDIHHKKTREFWKKKGFIEEKKFIWADKQIKV